MVDINLIKLIPHFNIFRHTNKSEGVTIDNCTSHDNGGDGIRIEKGQSVSIKNTKTYRNGGNGINIENE